MAPESMLLGLHGRQTIIGSAVTPIKLGTSSRTAYGLTVRVDGTIIAAYTDRNGNVVNTTAADSNVGIVLNNGEYVPFETPIASITLTGIADSVAAWLTSVK